MEHVFFQPWIGENYQTGGIFGIKILALGESHYCGDCSQCGLKYYPYCDQMSTTGIIKNIYLNGIKDKYTSTYLKFERALVNKETSLEDSNKIWNSIAFYNYLQVALPEPRKAGHKNDYMEAELGFFEVLQKLQPNLVFVWGKRLFSKLTKTHWIEGDSLVVDNYPIPNGYYCLPSGEKVRVVVIWHPSSGFSWDWWYKVISSEF